MIRFPSVRWAHICYLGGRYQWWRGKLTICWGNASLSAEAHPNFRVEVTDMFEAGCICGPLQIKFAVYSLLAPALRPTRTQCDCQNFSGA
jgi:hypothetical protein